MASCSGNFRKVSKKADLVKSFLINWKKDSATGVCYLGKFLKMDDFWQLILNS